MKTTITTLCLGSLLFVACNDQTADSEENPHGPSRNPGEGKFLLTTELPPELIEGTPAPIQDARGRPLPNLERPYTPPPPPRPRHTQAPPPRARENIVARPSPCPPPRHFREQPAGHERYGTLIDNSWQRSTDAPLSTFSIDVDTASYANLRRMILGGNRIPANAVRLEEMVNYFDYSYPQPTNDHPFAVHIANAACPWNPEHQLVRVALKGVEIERTERSPANLVFLLDVSGSMSSPDKLPLITESLKMLIEELNGSDTLSIVVYAGAEGLALPPTACDDEGRRTITDALQSFRAGGSTNGGAGINLAYQVALSQFKPGGINRVILATDGDFNVGTTNSDALVHLVAENARGNIYLSVLGTGTGNLNDHMLEAITNKGNGTYHYIDSLDEARRVFLDKMMGTLVTIAKDVKIQVEFNPDRVSGYRLLGYANRMLRKEDFSNDRIDAGDIGSGHTVTAFYEVETNRPNSPPHGDSLRYGKPATISSTDTPDPSPEWLTVKLRYKHPEGHRSALIEQPYTGMARDFSKADADFRFATSVAMTAMILRGTEGMETTRIGQLLDICTAARGSDPHGHRAEFISLLQRLASHPAL